MLEAAAAEAAPRPRPRPRPRGLPPPPGGVPLPPAAPPGDSAARARDNITSHISKKSFGIVCKFVFIPGTPNPEKNVDF